MCCPGVKVLPICAYSAVPFESSLSRAILFKPHITTWSFSVVVEGKSHCLLAHSISERRLCHKLSSITVLIWPPTELRSHVEP